MIVVMSILKSEDEFLKKLKELKESQLTPETTKFLEEVYASKLYYSYYSKFMDGRYRTTIDQFKKLIENPKSKVSQLKSALEIAVADVEDLLLQLEDYEQDEDYQNSKEDDESMMHEFLNNTSSIKFMMYFNTLAVVGLIIAFLVK